MGSVLGLHTRGPVARPESFVKVQLVLEQRKWMKAKTSARKGTAAPYFNEAFTFAVPFSRVQVGTKQGAGQTGHGPPRPT